MASPVGKVRNTKRMRSAREWYDARRETHERYARKLTSILEELLRARRVQFHRVEARVKTRQSFLEKADTRISGRIKYRAPSEQIKDVVGVRVITYLDVTVAEVCAFVESEFEIDRSNSIDKGEALGVDRVGYKSKHYVARLGRSRAELVEHAEFANIPFELQVRSLLQHAWAEVEHDRRFKYPGDLPEDIKRRFSLVAGQLESADREFNSIAREIDERAIHTARVASGVGAADALTIVNANEYLRGMLSDLIPSGTVEPGLGGDGAEVLMQDLTLFGVATLGALAELLPKAFVQRYPEVVAEQTTFIGLIRDAMILKDPERYFTNVWPMAKWQVTREDVVMFKACGIDIDPLLKTHGISTDEGLDDEDEDEDVELGECSICHRTVPHDELSAIGAGDETVSLVCPKCTQDIDDQAERDAEDRLKFPYDH